MSDVLIKAEGVSKKFCKSLKRSMLYGVQDIARSMVAMSSKTDELRSGEFWAVDNLSFELRRGECLGLIGPNGSGKSTLLKILNGIISPDKGRIEIRGRVGALIEIGAGFHPMLTGRENIYINGSILGFSKKEIDKKYDEIVEFAELGDFIDTPVKHYSSGMYVRLGFAIAAQMEPDVMLIDEVLAVGDFRFKQKCADKINAILKNASVILISHNMRDILMLCSMALVLQGGGVAFQGASEAAINSYLDMIDVDEKKGPGERKAAKEDTKQMQLRSSIYGEILHNKEKVANVHHRWVDKSGKAVESVDHATTVILEFSFNLLQSVDNLVIGVPIWDSMGHIVTGICTDMDNLKINIQKDGRVKGRLQFNTLIFNTGSYRSYIAIMDSREFLYRNCTGELIVNNMSLFFGTVTPEHSWHFE